MKVEKEFDLELKKAPSPYDDHPEIRVFVDGGHVGTERLEDIESQ